MFMSCTIWTPKVRPRLKCPNDLPLKWGQPSNQDTLAVPNGGRLEGVHYIGAISQNSGSGFWLRAMYTIWGPD